MAFKNIKLGIAPIGWTNDDMPVLGSENTFEQCISEIALAGFSGTEIGSKYPSDKQKLKKALDLRGISIASRWFSSFLATKDYEDVEKEFIDQLDFLSYLGAECINVSEQSYSIQGDESKSIFDDKANFIDEEWHRFCEGLNKLGKIAKDRGIKLCFHHHMGTGVQTIKETERMLDNTHHDLVFLCYDTGHWTFTGADPMYILNKYPERIGHVHLKDMRKDVRDAAIKGRWPFLKAVREGAFTVPGDGCVDFDPIFKKLDDIGYQGWFLVEAEQDPARANPFEYALKARKYIKDKTSI